MIKIFTLYLILLSNIVFANQANDKILVEKILKDSFGHSIKEHKFEIHSIEVNQDTFIVSYNLYNNYFILIDKNHQVIDFDGYLLKNHLFSFVSFVKATPGQYFLIQSNQELNNYNYKLYSKNEFENLQKRLMLIILLSCGGILSLLFYHTFLLFSANNKKFYLFYLIYLFSFFVYVNGTSSLLADFLRIFNLGSLIYYIQPIFGSIALICFKYFAEYFFNIQQSKKTKISNIFVGINVFGNIISVFHIMLGALFINLSSLYLLFYIFYLGFISLKQNKILSHKIYFFSWNVYIVVNVYYLIYYFYIIPYQYHFKYLLLLSVLFEAIFLAIAVGLKQKEEAEKLKNNNYKLLNDMKTIFNHVDIKKEEHVEESTIKELIEQNIEYIKRQKEKLEFVLKNSEHLFFSIHSDLSIIDFSNKMNLNKVNLINFFEKFMEHKEANNLVEVIKQLITDDVLNFELNSHLLKEDYYLNSNHYLFYWKPIFNNNVLTEIELSITNLTYKELQKQESNNKIEIFDLLKKIVQKQVNWNELNSMVTNVENLNLKELHTLKGNCRMIGLNHLSLFIHHLESEQNNLLLIEQIKKYWMTVVGEVEIFLQHKNRQDQLSINDLINHHSIFCQNLKSIAKNLNKKVNFKIIENYQWNENEPFAFKIRDVLSHLITNAIDHSLTTEKDGEVTIIINNKQIIVKDDGEGINWNKLIEKAMKEKIINSPLSFTKENLEKIIFSEGFSCKENATIYSGRGLGLLAAKQLILELGGQLTIDLQGKNLVFSLNFN